MSIVSASHIGAAASRGRPPGAAGKSLVFNEDFIDLTGIDLADTRAGGFKFYPKQWFGGGPTPTTSIVQIAPSVVRLGQRPGTDVFANRGRIQTASVTSEGSFFGNTWTGGAYFEVRMRWSQQSMTAFYASASPSFGMYVWPIEYLEDLDHNATSQWPGQASGFGHFAEVDIFEFAGIGTDGITYAGKQNYQATQHDWAGTSPSYTNHFYNSNTPNNLPAVPDWTQFHTYGALWTAQPNVSTVGSMQFYFDNQRIIGNDVFWKNASYPSAVPWPGSWPSTPQDRSTSGLADNKFAIVDAGHLTLGLDGHTELGMDVDFVRVWQ